MSNRTRVRPTEAIRSGGEPLKHFATIVSGDLTGLRVEIEQHARIIRIASVGDHHRQLLMARDDKPTEEETARVFFMDGAIGKGFADGKASFSFDEAKYRDACVTDQEVCRDTAAYTKWVARSVLVCAGAQIQ